MKRVLELAHKGMGKVAPNPMVGCIIVRDERIIAEGYHQKYGEAHAEVNAINQLPENYDFSSCTLYVNLEPCSHYGKTPPCADLIVSRKFKKVVVGNVDTNPLVGGKGIEKLKKAGIEVESGILNEECRELNKRFFSHHEKGRPYIILKWAQSADGFISKLPLPKNREDNWITGDESKRLVHHWRAQEQAIMVGTNTVINDDPELTVRLGEGENPVRIVIDQNLKAAPSSKVYNNKAETIVFNSHKNETLKNVNFIVINFSENIIPQILKKLCEKGVSSMIIEGGAKLLQSFIDEGMWDEARVFSNPDKRFENGIKAPILNLNPEVCIVGKDLLYLFKNKSD